MTNCTFTSNVARIFPGIPESDGGGMYNEHSSPMVTNCVFVFNSARRDGGGMYNKSSSPVVTNCLFDVNTASEYRGGGMANVASTPTVTNCTFSNNGAWTGGAISSDFSSVATVTNCILWGNSCGPGGSGGTHPEIHGTADVSYSIVEGGHAGVGNMGENPIFFNPGWDYRLQSSSPAIDAADGSAAPEFDVLGTEREDDPLTPNTGFGPLWADMGAHEYVPPG